MKVKIDTKEKFHVITPEVTLISANMTGELKQMLLSYLEKDCKNVILNLGMVTETDTGSVKMLFEVQQAFYDQQASFVICEIQKPIEDMLEHMELLDIMNITPTESEAWDIVQMEEIEREFLD